MRIRHPFVKERPLKPVLIFDGECGFCQRWISRWHTLSGERIDYLPSQEVGRRFTEISDSDYARSVQFVEPDGRWSSGAEAVVRSLAVHRSRQWILWVYLHFPGAALASEWGYRLVAGNRRTASWISAFLWGPQVDAPRYERTRDLFLRSLAIIYLIAFASLWPQIRGLLGERGILPAKMLMERVHEQIPGKFYLLPTLAWWRADDRFLLDLCGAGVILSALAFFLITPALLFGGLWLLYLSITAIGGDFLSFQWDLLLLEAGFLAIFFAPLQLWPRTRRSSQESSRLFLWLLRFLLFKLMVQSALVKWLSGDASWHHLTALPVYYETMPLPNTLSWIMHQLPTWFHKISVIVVFFIEGIVPFGIFLPRRFRLLSCGLMVALQGLMVLTGNYGFFNWLTIALCLTLLDDRFILQMKRLVLRMLGNLLGSRSKAQKHEETPVLQIKNEGWLKGPRLVVGLFIVCVSALKILTMLGVPRVQPLLAPAAWFEPFRSINNYGLFSVMTTIRPEIQVEGSDDGTTWKVYEFKYKMQDLHSRPKQVAPYMPRLDWQMWFAALGDYRQNQWFINFCVRLLEGSPEALHLLKTNPFPVAPPRYMRGMLYDYHFTNWHEHSQNRTWWRRTFLAAYCPTISLKRQ